MVKPWGPGRDAIEKMIADGELKKIAGYNADGTDLLDNAVRAHASSVLLKVEDPRGAIILAYDAGRLACEALLAHQGLRARVENGHHAIVFAAVTAQFGKRFSDIDLLRRRRNELEYPTHGVDKADDDEAQEAIVQTEQLLDAVSRLMPELAIWN